MNHFQTYLHLDEVDHWELMSTLLHHFGNAQNTSAGVYRYQKIGLPHFVDIKADIDDGHIKTVTFSEGFPEKDLTTLEQTIKTTLMTSSVSAAQDIIFCNEKVIGFFKYKDKFQIIPVAEGSPMPVLGLKNFPFIIEFTYNPSTDVTIDYSRRRKQATVYTRLLNLLLNQHLQLNRNDAQTHWVMHIDEANNNKVSYAYEQEGYAADGFQGKMSDFSDLTFLSEMKKIPFQEYYTKSRGITSDPLTIPDNLEQSLDVIFGLNNSDWDRFFMACSWYSQSSEIWYDSSSSAFISLVTALECLVDKKEKCECCKQDIPDSLEFCECCKQPKYQVTKHFKEFLESYCPFISSYPREKKTLYGIRSKLAHGSDLLQQDLQPWIFMMDPKKDEQSSIHRNLFFITSVSIYNWLWSRSKHATIIA